MKKLLILTLGVVLIGVSCKKKNKYDNSDAPKLNAQVETAFDEMTNISDQAVKGNLVYYAVGQVHVFTDPKEASEVDKAACSVVITIDTLSTPRSITVDWGTSTCDCNDGKTRRGKIITTYTGSYYAQGTVITHTPVDYYVNGIKIEGTKTVTNMGLNGSSKPYYSVAVNGVATFTTGEVVHYTSSRVRTFTDGYTTQNIFIDDQYDITGTASASVDNGDSYTAEITEALHLKVGCPYVTSGKLNITRSGKPIRAIDFGSGSCDATFTITVNGNTYTVN